MPYRIRNWNDNFETAKSRTIEKCSWVPMPNRQDGLGFTRIMVESDGAAIYGIWCLIVGACSRQNVEYRNGWLTDDGKPEGSPWTPEDLAMRWRRPLKEVRRALEFLTSDPIGWLDVYQDQDDENTCRIPGTPEVSPAVPPKYPDTASKKARKEYSVKAQEVFDRWVEAMGKSKATKFPPNSKRYRRVIDRLKDGYSVEDLCLAIEGCKRTPHNMGQNDRGKRFNDLELICRDVEHVDGFIETARGAASESEGPDEWTSGAKELISLCESGELKAKISAASTEAQKICGRIGIDRLAAMDMATVRSTVYQVADRMAGRA